MSETKESVDEFLQDRANQRSVIDTFIDAVVNENDEMVNELMTTIEKVKSKRPLDHEEEQGTPKKPKVEFSEKDTLFLQAVTQALEGKKLDASWEDVQFVVFIMDPQDNNQELANDENPAKTHLVDGKHLNELLYKVIMAVGYQMDILTVGDAEVSLVDTLLGWLSDKHVFVETDKEEEEKFVRGREQYSNNKETFGCLHEQLSLYKGPSENVRIVRAWQ